jgi:hypothetical protein
MATVSVTPETFELVEFDAAEIIDIASQVCDTLGLPADTHLTVEVDEVVMMPRVEGASISGKDVTVRVSGGAFEDQRQARHLSPERTRNTLAQVLLKAGDRLTPAFADAPSDDELTTAQASAWDTYADGRLIRLGVPARRSRRLYHFRLRHGFTDKVDEIFEQLWDAESLAWTDVNGASAAARGAGRDLLVANTR